MRVRTHTGLLIASSIFLFLLIPHIAFADGQLYIIQNSDSGGMCTQIGTWDQDTESCTLTDDVDGYIEIDDSFITLDGAGHTLTVDGPYNSNGILIYGAAAVTIENLAIKGGNIAIYFNRANNGKALNNTVAGSNIGVHFSNTVGGEASGNSISESPDGYGASGIDVSGYSYDTAIHNNTISGVNNGINAENVSGASIQNNDIDDVSTGIRLNSVQTLAVLGNTITNAATQALYINMSGSTQNTINKNAFEDSAIGVTVLTPGRVMFSLAHPLASNLAALNISDSGGGTSSDTTTYIFGNDFENDATPAVVSPSSPVQFWKDLPDGGNTWDTYDESSEGCIDADGDGFCDGPYVIDATNNVVDQYPHARPAPPAPVDPCVATNSCVSNVMFLPGIEGSRLYEGTGCGKTAEEKLWEPADGIGDVLLGNQDGKVKELSLDTNGESVCSDIYTKDGDIIDSAGGNIYKSFIDEMNGLKSGGTINDWKPVSYDWRLSLDDLLNNGTEQDEKIYYELATDTPYILQTLRALAATSKTGKVTIVAHSNGGLVAKALLNELGDADAAKLVDKVIMVAVPQSGAPAAIGSTLVGYDAGINAYGVYSVVSNEAARSLAQNSPMAYHLLPSEEYLESIAPDAAHHVATFEGDGYSKEIAAYGSNIGNLADLDSYLLGKDGGRQKPADDDLSTAEVLNPTLIDYANKEHSVLDAWTPPAGIEVDQIAGWGIDTVAGIDFYTQPAPTDILSAFGVGPGTVREYRPIFTEDGDDTVPVPSALMMAENANVKRYWLDLHSYLKNENVERTHKDIFEVPFLRDFIKEILENQMTSYPEYISSTSPAPITPSKKLIFFLHSPLTLQLTDSSGNTTGLAQDGSISENIPDSSYGEFGDVKYIIAPEGGQYQLSMHGQATGSFSLDMQEFSDDTITASSTIANIPTTASTTANLTISNGIGTVSTLTVDENSDGKDVITIQPVPGKISNYIPPQSISAPVSAPTPIFAHASAGAISIPVILSPVYATSTAHTTASSTRHIQALVQPLKQIKVSTTTAIIIHRKLLKVSAAQKKTTQPVPQSAAALNATSQQPALTNLGSAVYNGWYGILVILRKLF
ncbi:MAG: NosD domain-containing protein [Minisyncoccia bacterium]